MKRAGFRTVIVCFAAAVLLAVPVYGHEIIGGGAQVEGTETQGKLRADLFDSDKEGKDLLLAAQKQLLELPLMQVL